MPEHLSYGHWWPRRAKLVRDRAAMDLCVPSSGAESSLSRWCSLEGEQCRKHVTCALQGGLPLLSHQAGSDLTGPSFAEIKVIVQVEEEALDLERRLNRKPNTTGK